MGGLTSSLPNKISEEEEKKVYRRVTFWEAYQRYYTFPKNVREEAKCFSLAPVSRNFGVFSTEDKRYNLLLQHFEQETGDKYVDNHADSCTIDYIEVAGNDNWNNSHPVKLSALFGRNVKMNLHDDTEKCRNSFLIGLRREQYDLLFSSSSFVLQKELGKRE
jgi:hypothetical protein